MPSNADRFLATAERNHWTADTVVPDGRMAGKTVKEVYEALKAEEASITGLAQAGNAGDMSLEDAIQMLMASPDPRSARIPYGPYQGMGLTELMQRAEETKKYYEDAGIIAPEPKEPGMVEQFMPVLGSFGGTIGGMYASDLITNQSALNAANAEFVKAQTAALQGSQQGAQLGAQALPRATPPGVPSTPSGPMYGPQPAPVSGAEPLAQSLTSDLTPYGTTLDPTATSGWGSSVVGGNTSATPVFGFNPAVAPAAVAAAGLGYELSHLAKDPKQWLKGEDKFNGINGASIIRNKVSKLLGFGDKHDQAFYDRADARDAFREDSNIYDGNTIGLAGGGKWDIGSMGDSYNIDFSGEDAGRDDEISKLDALTYALTGFQGKRRSDQVGELYNAANSSGDAMANIRQIALNSGRTFDELRQSIRDATDIDENTRQVWLANVDQLEQYSGPTAAAQLPGSGKGSSLPPAVDRNAGRPAPVRDPMAQAITPTQTAKPGQKKGNVRLKAFWGS